MEYRVFFALDGEGMEVVEANNPEAAREVALETLSADFGGFDINITGVEEIEK
jgi:hypothetical protein